MPDNEKQILRFKSEKFRMIINRTSMKINLPAIYIVDRRKIKKLKRKYFVTTLDDVTCLAMGTKNSANFYTKDTLIQKPILISNSVNKNLISIYIRDDYLNHETIIKMVLMGCIPTEVYQLFYDKNEYCKSKLKSGN